MSILQKLDNLPVLILGDVMIDRYLNGSVQRISPEAPVPVVQHQSTEDRLGGAANVALNVQALGGRAWLCSIIGEDEDGQKLLEKMSEHQLPNAGIYQSKARRTTVKTRILGNQQQMLRIDREDTHDIDQAQAEILWNKALKIIAEESIRVIILQDYNKGVLTEWLIKKAIQDAKKAGVFTAVDPKKVHFFTYEGVNLFKPNLKEVQESMPFPVSAQLDSLQKAADFLQEKLKNQYTMLTLSENGLFLDAGKGGKCYPTIPRKISDVSGAGDTVISIAAMSLAAGMDLDTVALLSNLAGGQVCETPRVVPINREKLAHELAQIQAIK